MQQKIKQVLEEALAGSRKVKITFKQEVFSGNILYLLIMILNDEISMSRADRLMLRAIAEVRGWDPNNNDRAYMVTLTAKFDADWFCFRMHEALENIEVVD